MHGVGVAFWVGALAPLVAMAWRPDSGAAAGACIAFRASRYRSWALLVLTGLVLAIIQLESFAR